MIHNPASITSTNPAANQEDIAEEDFHLATYEDPHHFKISQKPDTSHIEDEQIYPKINNNESYGEDIVIPVSRQNSNCHIERCEIVFSSQMIDSCSIKKTS